jgi:hypothetical protein
VTADLRRAVTGLLSFAAAEEQALLAADAIEANPDLRANARRDPDLEVLREAGP